MKIMKKYLNLSWSDKGKVAGGFILKMIKSNGVISKLIEAKRLLVNYK